jgi:hypothetical protein
MCCTTSLPWKYANSAPDSSRARSWNSIRSLSAVTCSTCWRKASSESTPSFTACVSNGIPRVANVPMAAASSTDHDRGLVIARKGARGSNCSGDT